uniref:F-box only protein 33 isoform X2 n=1 Tax=Myxine glutinosa TaxID=7769 RepID=UPI00358F8088
MALSLCRQQVDPAALPWEIIVHVLAFLPGRDRLAASSVCSRWRACLFHPSLWPRLHLRLAGPATRSERVGDVNRGNEEKGREDDRDNNGDDGENVGHCLQAAAFLVRRCGAFVRDFSLAIEVVGRGFVSGDGSLDALRSHAAAAVALLRPLARNRNLEKLALLGDSVVDVLGPTIGTDTVVQNLSYTLLDPDNEKSKELQWLLRQLLRSCKRLRWLSLAFMLEAAAPDLLQTLPSTTLASLQHLSLLRLHGSLPLDNSGGDALPLLRPAEASRLMALRCLALDAPDFTAELAQALARRGDATPLSRLCLLLHHQHPRLSKSLDGMPQDQDWRALATRNPLLRVYVMAVGVGAEPLHRLFRPGLPLERLHLDGCPGVSTALLDNVGQQYNRWLSHMLLVREMNDMGPPALNLNTDRAEDPLVLLAWKCSHLARLTVHGYLMWDYDIVAIARLRGPSLLVLEVTEESLDFDLEALQLAEGLEGRQPQSGWRTYREDPLKMLEHQVATALVAPPQAHCSSG